MPSRRLRRDLSVSEARILLCCAEKGRERRQMGILDSEE